MHLARVLLITPVFHYVDDFSGVDPAPLAQSGFDAFEDLSALLRVKLKHSKRQPPAASRDELGVVLEINDNTVLVKPRPNRRERLITFTTLAIKDDKLTGPHAERLAGQLNFYFTAVCGMLGYATLHPIYIQATYRYPVMTVALRAALHTVLYLLNHAPPRIIPLRYERRRRNLLYADAFFGRGSERLRCADIYKRGFKHGHELQFTSNGWGAIVVQQDAPAICVRGEIPLRILEKLQTKKTHVYFLEVLGQCFGAWLFTAELGDVYWAFVDNCGARCSLLKGYSKNPDGNLLISLFWHYAATKRTVPWFEHVPSAAQLADGVSRDDWTIPKERSWLRISPDFDPFWDLLCDILDSGSLATVDHVERLDAWIVAQRSAHPPVVVG